MPNDIPPTCEHCLNIREVRTASPGQSVACNHCGTSSVAQQLDGATASADSTAFAIGRTWEREDLPVDPRKAEGGPFSRDPQSLQEKSAGFEESDTSTDALRRVPDDLRADRGRLADGWMQTVAAFDAIMNRLQAVQGLLNAERERAARAEIAFQSEREACRKDREQITALRQERDRLAENVARGEWPEMTGTEPRQSDRDTRDERLQFLEAELERQRLAVEQERRAHRKGLAAQRGDLEAGHNAELERVRKHAHSDAQAVREELASLRALVDRLQWERDEALEQIEKLRSENDQQYEKYARLETGLEEIEERHRTEVERLTLASGAAREQAETATRREADLAGQLEPRRAAIGPSHGDRDSTHDVPDESSGEPSRDFGVSPPTPSNREPECAAAEGPGHREPDGSDTTATPTPPVTSGQGRPEVPIVEEGPGNDEGAKSAGDESPEHRILSLRQSLGIGQEVRSRGLIHRPFFTRLTRIWKHSGSAR
jgi:hypothetical protein